MDRVTALIKSFITEEDGGVVSEYGLLIVVLVLGLSIALIAFKDKVIAWFSNIGDNLEACGANGC